MKRVVVIAVLAMGLLAGHLEAMQQGESSQKQELNKEPSEVIVITSEGQKTPIAIDLARFFGVLSRKLDAAQRGDENSFRFFDEFDVDLGKVSLEEEIELRRVTKPVLDTMLLDIYRHIRHDSPLFGNTRGMDIPALLQVSGLDINQPYPMLRWPRPIPQDPDQLEAYIIEELSRRITLLRAAYDMDFPQLASAYADQVVDVLADQVSLDLLKQGRTKFLEIIGQLPLELQGIMKNTFYNRPFSHHLKEGRRVDVSSSNGYLFWDDQGGVWYISDTIEKYLFGLLLWYCRDTGQPLHVTPWALEMWHNLDDNHKKVLIHEFRNFISPLTGASRGLHDKRARPTTTQTAPRTDVSKIPKQHFKHVVYPELD